MAKCFAGVEGFSATATPFWDVVGMPVSPLPDDFVMTTDDLVDAALAGFDMGEVYTIPALADVAQFTAYEAARVAMVPNLSKAKPAARYGLSRARAAFERRCICRACRRRQISSE